MQSIYFQEVKQAQKHWRRSLIFSVRPYHCDTPSAALSIFLQRSFVAHFRVHEEEGWEQSTWMWQGEIIISTTLTTSDTKMSGFVGKWERAVTVIDSNFSRRFGTGPHIPLVCKQGYYRLENQMSKNQFHGEW